jgi:hypothetical protein
MISEKVVDRSSLLNPQFVVDTFSIEVLRQRSAVVIDENIQAIMDELGVLLSVSDDPLYATAERIMFIASSFLASRCFCKSVLIVPRVSPENERVLRGECDR